MSPLDRIASVSILKVPRGCSGWTALPVLPALAADALASPRSSTRWTSCTRWTPGRPPAPATSESPWHGPGRGQHPRGTGASPGSGFIPAGLAGPRAALLWARAGKAGPAQGGSHSLCAHRFCFLVRPRLRTMRHIAGERGAKMGVTLDSVGDASAPRWGSGCSCLGGVGVGSILCYGAGVGALGARVKWAGEGLLAQPQSWQTGHTPVVLLSA